MNCYSIGKLLPDGVQGQADEPDQHVQDRGAPYSAEAIGRRRQPRTVGLLWASQAAAWTRSPPTAAC